MKIFISSLKVTIINLLQVNINDIYVFLCVEKCYPQMKQTNKKTQATESGPVLRFCGSLTPGILEDGYFSLPSCHSNCCDIH